MRILIIKTSPLSDLIAALPVLDYLHKAVQGAEIDWVVEEEFREILEGNPLVESLITVKGLEWKKTLLSPRTFREIGSLKETLAEKEYDYLFDLEGSLKSGMISRLVRTRNAIGFEKADALESGNIFFTMRRIPLRRQDRHATLRCLRLVSVPFAKDYGEMELSSTIATGAEEDLAAKALLSTLSDGLVFLFECGADSQTKLWSEQGWVELGKKVLDAFPDAAILLTWETDSERELATAIAKTVQGARVIDRHTLKGLAALLKKVDLVVGGDTETVQLAAAVGTPTVSFYRSTDGKQSGPRGEQHVIVQSPIHCTRCLRVHCDKDAQCRGTIKVETMLAAIEKLFGPPGGAR